MRKETKIKIKILILLCAFAILAALAGCSLPSGINEDKGRLLIFLGVQDLTRKTYTPEVDLSMFEVIDIKVYKEKIVEETIEEEIDETIVYTVVEKVVEEVFAEITRNPQYQSTTIELLELPYDTYFISARAYLSESHKDEDNCTAFGKIEFTFTGKTPWATVTMDPFIGEEGTTGMLRYKLINAIGLPVQALLYPYDDISEESKMILTQGTNPLDPVSGFYSMPLDSGFYMFFFGENAPSVVQIYKNMETVLEEVFSIYGSLNVVINPEANSDVQVLLSNGGSPISNGEILSYGTEVTVTIVQGSVYRYIPGTLTLNNGSDDNWFITQEEPKTLNDSHSRTFRMPARDVVVSVQTEIMPVVDINFSDPNLSEYLKFRNVADNSVIDSANPGQEITVTFDHPSGAGIPFAVQAWLLDLSQVISGDPANLKFTVPDPCNAWSVTAIVIIGNVPHSVSIPIRH